MNAGDFHGILFTMHLLYSLLLGLWAAVLAGRDRPLGGNYWGAVLISALLAGAVLLLGLAMLAAGLRPPRLTTYVLYMLWLVVMMPGTYSLLHGREDRSAALAYAILGGFQRERGAEHAAAGVGGAVGVRVCGLIQRCHRLECHLLILLHCPSAGQITSEND